MDLTRKIAEQLGWEITKGSLGVHEACTIGKAKRINLPKTGKLTLKWVQIKMYLGIATLKDQKADPESRNLIGVSKSWNPLESN